MANHKFRFLGILALLALGCGSGESTTSTNTAKNVGGTPTKTTLLKPASGEAGQYVAGPAGEAGVTSGEAGATSGAAGGPASTSGQGGSSSVAGASTGGQPEAGSPGSGSTGVGGSIDAAGQAGSIASAGVSNGPGGASGAGQGGSPTGVGGAISGAAGASAGVAGSPAGAGAGGSSAGKAGSAGSPAGAGGSLAGSAGSTAGAGGAALGCTQGTRRCVGYSAETCDATGQWLFTEWCSICTGAGVCGHCSPGQTKCTGLQAQTCDATGFWQTTQTCPYLCTGGACSGSCTPGAVGCSGLNAQTCSSSGQWQTTQTCPYVCSAGSCTGSCTPGAVGCNGLTARKCDTAGTWVDQQVCPLTCSAGNCTTCTPGATQCNGLNAQTCDGAGNWQTTQACPYVCSAGSCTGVCTPGTVSCSGTTPQTCNSSGQWVSGTACPTFTGSTTTCTGAGVCGFTCNAGYSDCDGLPGNGCEAQLSADPNNCSSCGHSCGGGACSSGICQAMTLASGLNQPYHLTTDSTSVYWSDTTGVRSVPLAGGTIKNLILSPGSGGGIGANGNYMYYAGDSYNYTCNISGGNCSGSSNSNGTYATEMKIYGGNLYYASSVRVMAAVEGFFPASPTSIYTSPNWPGGGVGSLNNVGSTLYWKDYNYTTGWTIKAMTGTGPYTPSTIASGGILASGCTGTPAASLSSLAVDGTYLYWLEDACISTVRTTFIKRQVIGDTSSTMNLLNLTAAGITTATNAKMLVDGTNLYIRMTTPTDIAGIIIVNKTTGVIRQITTERAGDITIDANYLYWTVNENAPTGAIKRIVKN